ncbi:SDR family oxidoreductase [Saccharicrinis sp. FJH54]|uniref:SDR family oxidoreductase n=1 Tax=Saccharicrinis sp. FJH54 TaxID=3344665 RepID=UPI0035D4B3E6
METIAVAGSTGYLGKYIVKTLLKNGYQVLAIARSPSKLKDLPHPNLKITKADVTAPSTLKNCFKGVKYVISTVGITRQKDGLTYMDVDYQANMNLLNEAKQAGVKKFIYTSAIKGDQYRYLKIFEAKEKFVDALKNSGLSYTVMRPNGFFSDMTDFFNMAKSGRIYLFGSGEYKLNPIHGQDLAEVFIRALNSNKNEIEVGGPDVLSQNQIGELALRALNKPVKIIHLPDWIRKLALWSARTFTSSKTYGPIEFFLTLMADDAVASSYGSHHLDSYYHKLVQKDNLKKTT